ncbi:Hypothetical predicted protein [Prunus dulcis]|uniref:Uncharacterized protein n=1 Tax=Prunus dulcis TaxID=3755 RepID=A0A5E4G5V7_PRUDU|nr:Hypothetical predicted protein [Prunus dulcis]
MIFRDLYHPEASFLILPSPALKGIQDYAALQLRISLALIQNYQLLKDLTDTLF